MQNNYNICTFSTKDRVLFGLSLIACGMTIGLLFYDNPFIGIAFSCLMSPYQKIYKKNLIEKRKNKLLVQFRDLLYSVSSSISAGRNMAQALEESLDFWKATYDRQDYIMTELSYMVKRIKESNEKDLVVLKDFAARSGLDDVWDFVNVYESCKNTGGNIPRAINRATTIIGDKISLDRELAVMMSQKAFESKIVALSPFVLVILLKITSPDYLQPMYTTQSGRVITTFALGLMALALILIERMNRIEL